MYFLNSKTPLCSIRSILTFRVGSFFCSGQNKYDQENGIDLGHFESTNDNDNSNKEHSGANMRLTGPGSSLLGPGHIQD